MKILKKIKKRIKCKHKKRVDIYCNTTGLFMYKECTNCGKKIMVW